MTGQYWSSIYASYTEGCREAPQLFCASVGVVRYAKAGRLSYLVLKTYSLLSMQNSENLPSRNDDNKIFNRSNGYFFAQYFILYILVYKHNNYNNNLLEVEDNLFL